MKGKILAGIVLWCIGAIYVFLIYPLLHNSPDVTSNPQSEVRSIGDTNVIPARVYPDYVGEQGSIDFGSSPEWQTNNIQKEELTASSQQIKANTICFDSHCFTIEIANTLASRQQGLMHRSSLPQDAGMLFVFDTPGSYGFWMKNTLIPLDIIRMDEKFVVVDTATMIPCSADPCPSYNHRGLAMYALEINAWLVQEYGIVPGMQFVRK